VLKFAFHKAHPFFLNCWLVECIPNTPQVIGISDKFDFDLTHFNPPWMNNIEDGCLTERPKRLQVAPAAPAAPAWDIQVAIRTNLAHVLDLGFSPEQAVAALEACNGNLEQAVALLFGFDD
jgi:hypothetical protein